MTAAQRYDQTMAAWMKRRADAGAPLSDEAKWVAEMDRYWWDMTDVEQERANAKWTT